MHRPTLSLSVLILFLGGGLLGTSTVCGQAPVAHDHCGGIIPFVDDDPWFPYAYPAVSPTDPSRLAERPSPWRAYQAGCDPVYDEAVYGEAVDELDSSSEASTGDEYEPYKYELTYDDAPVREADANNESGEYDYEYDGYGDDEYQQDGDDHYGQDDESDGDDYEYEAYGPQQDRSTADTVVGNGDENAAYGDEVEDEYEYDEYGEYDDGYYEENDDHEYDAYDDYEYDDYVPEYDVDDEEWNDEDGESARDDAYDSYDDVYGYGDLESSDTQREPADNDQPLDAGAAPASPQAESANAASEAQTAQHDEDDEYVDYPYELEYDDFKPHRQQEAGHAASGGAGMVAQRDNGQWAWWLDEMSCQLSHYRDRTMAWVCESGIEESLATARVRLRAITAQVAHSLPDMVGVLAEASKQGGAPAAEPASGLQSVESSRPVAEQLGGDSVADPRARSAKVTWAKLQTALFFDRLGESLQRLSRRMMLEVAQEQLDSVRR